MKFVLAVLLLVACAQARVHSPHPLLRSVGLQKGMDTRIMYGEEAGDGMFPWQAGLVITMDTFVALCGGSLISDLWVVTAAHCTQGAKEIKVELGGRVWHEMEYMETSSEYVVHERYGPEIGFDISLIKLPKPVTFSAKLSAIRLPSRDYHDVTGRMVVASGYGRAEPGSADVLKYTYMTAISFEQCHNYYGSNVVELHVCTVARPTGSPCSGDSGGPLVDYSPVPTLIGVTNFVGNGNCDNSTPIGFARVTSYLDWINQHTGIQY